MRKLVCVHGWDGSPDGGWWPWLKVEAKKIGLEVHAPHFPGAEHPKLVEWVKVIDSLVGTDYENTILIGHSLGCDAILRYVERQPKTARIHAMILIAAFFDEKDLKDLAEFNGQAVNVERVKLVAHQKVAFFSSNDPYVPLKEGIDYQHRLGAQIHILKNRGHFTARDNCISIPEVLESLRSILKN